MGKKVIARKIVYDVNEKRVISVEKYEIILPDIPYDENEYNKAVYGV